jgi:hypothetical protein
MVKIRLTQRNLGVKPNRRIVDIILQSAIETHLSNIHCKINEIAGDASLPVGPWTDGQAPSDTVILPKRLSACDRFGHLPANQFIEP